MGCCKSHVFILILPDLGYGGQKPQKQLHKSLNRSHLKKEGGHQMGSVFSKTGCVDAQETRFGCVDPSVFHLTEAECVCKDNLVTDVRRFS